MTDQKIGPKKLIEEEIIDLLHSENKNDRIKGFTLLKQEAIRILSYCHESLLLLETDPFDLINAVKINNSDINIH